jgi:hypothetical protein
MGRQNRRHTNQVLLLDIRVAQGEFECCQPLPMNTDAVVRKKLVELETCWTDLVLRWTEINYSTQ